MREKSYPIELFRKYRKEIAVNIFLLLIITCLSVTGPLVLRNIMNRTGVVFDQKSAAVYFTILFLLYFFRFLSNRYKFSFEEKFKNLETVNLYQKIFRMRYDKINQLEPTYLSERVNTTVDTVFHLYASSITGIFVSGLILLITLSMVFRINKILFAIFFVQVPLQYFGFQKLLNGEHSKLAGYSALLQETKAKSSKNIKVLLADVNGVKQYGESGIILPLIRENLKEVNSLGKKANRYAMDVCTILEFFCVCLKNASYFLILFLYMIGEAGTGDFIYLTLINDIYYGSIGDVIKIQINLRELKGAFAFVSEEVEKNYEESGTKELKDVVSMEGTLHNVGYEGKILIEDGAFHMEKGDVIGIVGESGCGKTTFVKLFNRFQDGGKIVVNGHDITEYDVASLRKKILYLPQNTYLLPCSVKENLFIGNQGDHHRWDALLRLKFMQKLIDGGLEKIILENASNLSGGDRQKIILGRIFLQKTCWIC